MSGDEATGNKAITEGGQNILAQSLAQCWLAEYQCLKNEALTLSRGGNTLIGINITVVGIILGIWELVTFPSGVFCLFLVMSLVSSSLGLIWIAGQRYILKVSNYINSTITPAIRDILANIEIFKWEEKVRSPFKMWEFFAGTRQGSLIVIFMFFVPSLTGLGVAIYGMVTQHLWGLWYFISLLVAVVIVILMLLFSGWRWFCEWPFEKKRG